MGTKLVEIYIFMHSPMGPSLKRYYLLFLSVPLDDFSKQFFKKILCVLDFQGSDFIKMILFKNNENNTQILLLLHSTSNTFSINT